MRCFRVVWGAMLIALLAGGPAAALDLKPTDASQDVLRAESKYGAADTLGRLETAIAARGLTVFPRIDHAAAARAKGLAMPPTWVVIFGRPEFGTGQMIKNPTSAIDFPLKMLVYEDAVGKVWIAYNAPAHMKQIFERHGRPGNTSGYEKAMAAILVDALK